MTSTRILNSIDPAAMLDELSKSIKQMLDLGEEGGVDAEIVQATVSNINRLLPFYESRYKELSTEINKALQRKTRVLAGNLTLFSSNRLNQDIVNWNLSSDAAHAQELMNSNATLEEKISVSKKLNRETRHVCRKQLKTKFAEIFLEIDTTPQTGDKEMKILRGEIKAAIEKYIYHSTSRIGLWFGLRAASTTRMANMEYILSLTNAEVDASQLRWKISRYIGNLHGELARNLTAALAINANPVHGPGSSRR